MTTISNIVDAVAAPYTVWRTLRGIVPEMEGRRPRFVAGNAAVTFRVMHNGQKKSLKCYTRTNKHLPAIYGSAYLQRELCIVDITGCKMWIDCLLTPYIEGVTLEEALCRAATAEELKLLAAAFDQMACGILLSERAHGDLKPENIIVREDGQMEAIDWDAAYLPSLAGELALETGTAAYQHPLRTNALYDKHIDDYSIAAISVLLHTAAIDPTTLEHFRQYKEPRLQPQRIIKGDVAELERISELFARKGMAQAYRLSQMLVSPIPRLFNLGNILSPSAPEDDDSTPHLDQINGYWGCCADGRWLIKPHFDNGYEPTDGVMVAELGGYVHLVAMDGRIVRSFDRGTRIKPLRNGTTTAHYTDGREEIVNSVDLLQNLDK
ncbi:MAG: protein kinase [Alistipes sp.]|nr:protein kinase [Alistipes sp.]